MNNRSAFQTVFSGYESSVVGAYRTIPPPDFDGIFKHSVDYCMMKFCLKVLFS